MLDFYQLRPMVLLVDYVYYLFCGALQKSLPYLQSIHNLMPDFYQLRPVALLVDYVYYLFCGGLQKSFPYLQSIRNLMPDFYQLRPMVLSACRSLLFVLRRLAKELAVFAIHPQSSGMFLSVATYGAVCLLGFVFVPRRLRYRLLVVRVFLAAIFPFITVIYRYLPLWSYLSSRFKIFFKKK